MRNFKDSVCPNKSVFSSMQFSAINARFTILSKIKQHIFTDLFSTNLAAAMNKVWATGQNMLISYNLLESKKYAQENYVADLIFCYYKSFFFFYFHFTVFWILFSTFKGLHEPVSNLLNSTEVMMIKSPKVLKVTGCIFNIQHFWVGKLEKNDLKALERLQISVNTGLDYS